MKEVRFKAPSIVSMLLITLGLAGAAPARAEEPPADDALAQAVTAKLASAYGIHSDIVTRIDLTERFHTRSRWTLVVAKQPDSESKVLSGGGDPTGAVSVCFVQGTDPGCADARFLGKGRARPTGFTPEERAFYQLLGARIVNKGPGDSAPVLELRTCSLHGGNGNCLRSTFLFDYDRRHDAFRIVFSDGTGHNNNEETRFIEQGPLQGRVIVATPRSKAPFAYDVEVYKRKSGAGGDYQRVIKFSSGTRYDDHNTLAVIDAEMPAILRRAGLWKPGQTLPEPPLRPAGCGALVMRKGVEWCEARLDDQGFGVVRIGTALGQMPISLQQPIDRTSQSPSGACFYAFPASKTPHYALMMEDDQLTRIDVFKPGVRTDTGIAVGDPVGKIRAAYGAAAVEGREFYDDSLPEFTVKSADGLRALRFSTRDGRVTAIIAGRARSVAYVEGCL